MAAPPPVVSLGEKIMAAVFTAVDISTVAAFVSGAMVLVIGVALAYKAGYLGKRAIKAV